MKLAGIFTIPVILDNFSRANLNISGRHVCTHVTHIRTSNDVNAANVNHDKNNNHDNKYGNMRQYATVCQSIQQYSNVDISIPW